MIMKALRDEWHVDIKASNSGFGEIFNTDYIACPCSRSLKKTTISNF